MNANPDATASNPERNPERIGREPAPVAGRPSYVETRSLARLAASGLVLMAAICWTAAGYDLGELRSVLTGEAGGEDPVRQLAHQQAGIYLGALQGFGLAIAAAAFLPWLYEARCNLRTFGLRSLRFGREWTWLGFLVPGLNAVRPYQVMSEVWRGSVSRSSDPVAWRAIETPLLVTSWWATFLAWLGLWVVSTGTIAMGSGLGAVAAGHLLAATADVSAATSASLAVLLVTRIQRAQEECAAPAEGDPLREELLGGRAVA